MTQYIKAKNRKTGEEIEFKIEVDGFSHMILSDGIHSYVISEKEFNSEWEVIDQEFNEEDFIKAEDFKVSTQTTEDKLQDEFMDFWDSKKEILGLGKYSDVITDFWLKKLSDLEQSTREKTLQEVESIYDADSCECDNCRRHRDYFNNPTKEIKRLNQKNEAIRKDEREKVLQEVREKIITEIVNNTTPSNEQMKTVRIIRNYKI